jgi:GAF domain-containing protein
MSVAEFDVTGASLGRSIAPRSAASAVTTNGGRPVIHRLPFLKSQAQADAFTRLAHSLHDQPTLADTVEKVVESANALVGCDHAGILVLGKGHRIETFAAGDPVAQAADELQVELHEGPAVIAVNDGSTTLVPDTTADVRWPRWSSRMRDLDLGSAMGVPLWTSNATLGVLTLYARHPRWFDADAVAVAEVVGRHASIALSNAKREETLWRAVDARKLIGQAQGILMERFSLDADKAFEVLRRYSQDTNTKLNEVARDLVASRALPKY